MSSRRLESENDLVNVYLIRAIWCTKLGLLCPKGSRNYLPFTTTCVHPQYLMESVLFIFLVFCDVLCFSVLFVFVLCLVCPKTMLLMFPDCAFLLATLVYFCNQYKWAVQKNSWKCLENILGYSSWSWSSNLGYFWVETKQLYSINEPSKFY